jgi:GWxTD domain-containing protein
MKLMNVVRAVAFLALAACSLSLAADKRAALSERYSHWLNQDVVYIITDEERKEFLKLTSDNDRDKFMEDFWESRNPLRGSQQNPYKEEHYKRIEYANETFGRRSNTPGWRTDMGRTYILFGKPTSRAPFTGYGQIYPLELWFYSNNTGNPSLPPFFYVLFFIPEDIGEYRYYHPIIDGPMKLVRGSQFNSNADVYKFMKPLGGDISRAPFSLVPSEPMDMTDFTVNMSGEMLISKIQNFANDSFNVRRIHEMRTLRAKVSSWLLLAEGRPLDINPIVLADPLGQYWLDYAVSIDDETLGERDPMGKELIVSSAFRLSTAAGELIVEDSEERAYPAFEETAEGKKFHPFQIANRLPLVSGGYQLEVQVNNRKAGRSYKVEKNFVVDPPGKVALTGPLLAAAVETVGRPDPTTPFQYFGAQFHPAAGRRFTLREPLRVLFQIQASAADYQIEYVVANSQLREQRRNFTDRIAASEFKDGRLLKAKSIALTGLDPGDYRIVLNLHTTGVAAILASVTLPFRIGDSEPDTSLYFLANARNVASRGVAAYIRALESISQKDQAAGIAYLRQSLEQNPANAFASQYLIQLYFSRRQFQPVTELYQHLGIDPFKASAETLAQISVSFWQAGDAARAREVLETARALFPKNPLLEATEKNLNHKLAR